MPRLAAVLTTLALLVAALPAAAGNFGVEFPTLTYPNNSTVDTKRSCLSPATVTQACTPAK